MRHATRAELRLIVPNLYNHNTLCHEAVKVSTTSDTDRSGWVREGLEVENQVLENV